MMSLKTHKFARKPFYVDAVRVSEANIEEVAAWCEGTIESSDEGKYVSVKVHRPLTERQTQAFIGNWVLFAGSGFKVYTPKAFDKSFEKVRTLTKAQADEAGIKVPHERSQKPAKKHPSPKAMPKRRRPEGIGTPVLSEEQAAQLKEAPVEEPAPLDEKSAEMQETSDVVYPSTTGVPELDEPKSAADVEADKLIAEVLRQK